MLLAQAVELLGGELVAHRRDRHAQPLELRSVGVEPAREGLVTHVGVPLDAQLDVARGDGSLLCHEVGHERELADELVGVVGQGRGGVYRHRTDRGRAVRTGRAANSSPAGTILAGVIAHLDLDAFFAAVELHRHPGAARAAGGRGRRPGGARGGRHGELRGAQARHPVGHEQRRGPPPLSRGGVPDARPPHLPGLVAAGLVARLEPGPGGRAGRHRRGLPGAARGRPRRAGRPDPTGRARAPAALVLAWGRDLQGGGQDRVGCPQAWRDHRRAAGRRGGVPGAAARSGAARRRPQGSGPARGRRRDDDRPARRPGRRPPGGAPPREGRRGAAPASPRDRPAAGGRRARRGDLALERGDVRP